MAQLSHKRADLELGRGGRPLQPQHCLPRAAGICVVRLNAAWEPLARGATETGSLPGHSLGREAWKSYQVPPSGDLGPGQVDEAFKATVFSFHQMLNPSSKYTERKVAADSSEATRWKGSLKGLSGWSSCRSSRRGASICTSHTFMGIVFHFTAASVVKGPNYLEIITQSEPRREF